jgi:hypothetical protein
MKERHLIDNLLTIDQLAENIHVIKATIYSWTCAKKKFIKIAGQLRFRESDIEAFITANIVMPV